MKQRAAHYGRCVNKTSGAFVRGAARDTPTWWELSWNFGMIPAGRFL